MTNTGGESGLVYNTDVYKCCSCLKVPEGRIFLCNKRHSICSNCYVSRGKCVKCKDKGPVENYVRNEQLEEIMDGMRFDCEFSGKGCKEKLPRQILSRHLRTCSYREKKSSESPSPSKNPVWTSVVQLFSASVEQEDGPSTSSSHNQNEVGTLVVVKQEEVEVETASVPVIEISEDDDCLIIDEEEYPASLKTEDCFPSSNDAMKLKVDNPGEMSTINVKNMHGKASLTTIEVVTLSGDEDEVENTPGKIMNKDNSENTTSREIPSSSTNQPSEVSGSCRKRKLNYKEPSKSQQNAVGTSVVVSQEGETGSLPVIKVNEDCQVIQRKEHAASRIKTGTLTSSNDAIQLKVNKPGENSTMNGATPSSSSAGGLNRHSQKITSGEESNADSRTTAANILPGVRDEVEDSLGEIKNKNNSKHTTSREIPSSSTNQPSEVSGSCRKRKLNYKELSTPQQNAVGTSAVVSRKVEEASSLPVIKIKVNEDKGCLIIGEEEHPASRINTEALAVTSSNDAIQLDVDKSGENSTIRKITAGQESNAERRIPGAIILSGGGDKVVDILGEIKNKENSENTTNRANPSASTNRVSRKRKLSCKEPSEPRPHQETENKNKDRTKEVLDIFSFSTDEILRMTREPKRIQEYCKCKISFLEGSCSRFKISKVVNLFTLCGSQFEELVVNMPYSEKNLKFLIKVFWVINLKKLIYHYQDGEDALQFLNALKFNKEEGNFTALTCLSLVGASGKGFLTNEHIVKLSEVGIQFQSLEIGDSLWEDVTPESVGKLMTNFKSSLRALIIHGGFRGRRETTQKILTFPKMEVMTMFCLCPFYNYISEFKYPQFKKARMEENIEVELDAEDDEPIKATVKFGNSFPKLDFVVLGSLVDVEDLNFSTVQNLTTFWCGSYWNQSLRFPPDLLKNTVLQSNVANFQFPDRLKDPSFPGKIVKHFPKLKTVCLYLPSVAVLRAFFKAFKNSSLESFSLKTQFDFASTLESCLFPGRTWVQNEETKIIRQALVEYEHFVEYVSYYNLQLPAEDVSKTTAPGIAGLKNLKVLCLEHIPRNLLLPEKDEKRMWNDDKCKFRNITFGFDHYPLSDQCQDEILKLKLIEYYPTSMINKLTDKLHEGFNKKDKQACGADEELFMHGCVLSSITQVKIMPNVDPGYSN